MLYCIGCGVLECGASCALQACCVVVCQKPVDQLHTCCLSLADLCRVHATDVSAQLHRVVLVCGLCMEMHVEELQTCVSCFVVANFPARSNLQVY